MKRFTLYYRLSLVWLATLAGGLAFLWLSAPSGDNSEITDRV